MKKSSIWSRGGISIVCQGDSAVFLWRFLFICVFSYLCSQVLYGGRELVIPVVLAFNLSPQRSRYLAFLCLGRDQMLRQ
jgi:hypothetical protein